ncbi:AraC family transcriptional regulator [Corallococcus praedator]|uniref:AraC family transcriptional regulator n=1 Tax=Corallococcus praedator TaxID=2316724 RepID=A0ABX9QKB1_9BACT|nr:AraC family transcriptional regulator [Corallococcus praedator]
MGVSEPQVLRSFGGATALPPHAYLIALRVEVADLAGFSDQSRLTRHFKRMTSITPGAFARMAG